jgi:hypothetical protein
MATTRIRRGPCNPACTSGGVCNRAPVKRVVSVWGYLVS